MIVYVAYSKQYPYLPIAVADSPRELARLVGVKRNIISAHISWLKSGRAKTSPYHRVEVEEEET